MLRVRNIDIMKMLITSVPSVQLCVVLTYRVPVFCEVLLAKGRWIFYIMGPPSCLCCVVVRKCMSLWNVGNTEDHGINSQRREVKKPRVGVTVYVTDPCICLSLLEATLKVRY